MFLAFKGGRTTTDITSQHIWSASRILLFEGVVAASCLVLTFLLATVMNFVERGKHPDVWPKICLPALAGAAMAVVLTVANVTHDQIPNSLFLLNLLIGIGSGYVAYRLAPPKSLSKPFFRRIFATAPPKSVAEAEPGVLATKLPDKARPSPGRKRRETEAEQPKAPRGEGTAADYARRLKASK